MKKLAIGIILVILLSLGIFGGKKIYDNMRAPATYQPTSNVNIVPPVQKITPGKEVVVKEPGTKAILPASRWIPQTFNNCAPATVSMLLQHFGIEVSQAQTKADLRAGDTDTNVFTYEIVDYLDSKYGIKSKEFYGGDLQTLKKLIANGFYIMVEDWLHPNEDIGHNTIIRGFDDEQKVLIVDDSFIGVNLTFPYAQFDELQWKPFNREYVPLYKAENEDLLRAIVGENWDEKAMYQNAVKISRSEIAKNDQDMYAWFNLGTGLFALKDFEGAKNAFEKSRAIGWPRRMLWYQIQPVQVYNELKEYTKALELSGVGLAGNDLFSELHLERAIAYRGLGDIQKAREEAERAVSLAPLFKQAQDFLQTEF